MRVFTTAPVDYDYGYTVEIDPQHNHDIYPGRVVTGRIVEIPEEAAAYQKARYESGLYYTTEVK